MHSLATLCLLFLQTPAPLSPPSTQVPAVPAPAANAAPSEPGSEPQSATAPLEPWPGTVAEGFAAIRKHAEEGQFESARLIADRLLAPSEFSRRRSDLEARGGFWQRASRAAQPSLAWLGLDGLGADARAEVWFARGVVDSLAKQRPEAENDFQAARAVANDRGLRHDAIYDLGHLALEEGEEIRATIPEISGKPAAMPPPVPPVPQSPGGAPVEPPDPLQTARAAYLKAREHFVERLKSDWRDEDTRANVELCSRRLDELDRIEKKREEEKKKQEDQKKKEQDQNQDKKDEQQKKQDGEKDPKSKDEKGDSKDEPKPQDPKPEDADKDKKPEEQKPDDKKEPEKPDEKKDAGKPDPKDAQMSREEMTQLLDRLQQLEEEAKKIQAQLRAARRGKVKKDW
jgi:hypothetical protein